MAAAETYQIRPSTHPWRHRREGKEIHPLSINLPIDTCPRRRLRLRRPRKRLRLMRKISPRSNRPSTEEEEEDPPDTRLHFDDCTRFPAAAGGGHPWLFALSRDGRMLFGIDCLVVGDSKVYRATLPEYLHGYTIFSSVGHCLLLEQRGSPSGLRLFNPFSSNPKPACLPPPSSFTPPPPIDHPNRFKAIVPDPRSGFALALLHAGPSTVAYTNLDCICDERGGSWIDISHLQPDRLHSFASAAPYKPGMFCAVAGSGTQVVAFDLSGARDDPDGVRMLDMTFNLPDNHAYAAYAGNEDDYVPEDGFCTYQHASLVSSGPNLFLVRWRNTLDTDGQSTGREIDVFMLYNDNDPQWFPVTSLDHLSFFIGRSQSFSMSAADFPGLKPNRIYLPLDPLSPIAGDRYTCAYPFDDNGRHVRRHLVYDMDDKSWQSFHHDGFRIPKHYPPPPVWITPRPKLEIFYEFCMGGGGAGCSEGFGQSLSFVAAGGELLLEEKNKAGGELLPEEKNNNTRMTTTNDMCVRECNSFHRG